MPLDLNFGTLLQQNCLNTTDISLMLVLFELGEMKSNDMQIILEKLSTFKKIAVNDPLADSVRWRTGESLKSRSTQQSIRNFVDLNKALITISDMLEKLKTIPAVKATYDSSLQRFTHPSEGIKIRVENLLAHRERLLTEYRNSELEQRRLIAEMVKEIKNKLNDSDLTGQDINTIKQKLNDNTKNVAAIRNKLEQHLRTEHSIQEELYPLYHQLYNSIAPAERKQFASISIPTPRL